MDSGKLKFADTREMGSDRVEEVGKAPGSHQPSWLQSSPNTQPLLPDPGGSLNSLDLPSTLLQLLTAVAVILTF